MEKIRKIIDLLARKGYTVTTAESCTGGMIASTLINVAGISECYEEGYITYANASKAKLLGVDKAVLAEKGAVSEEVAQMMAEGAAKAADADAAVAVTGIAGPGGGTPQKPVGLVYIGCYVCGRSVVTKNHFTGSRLEIRQQTTEKALELLLTCIKESLQ